MTTEDSSLFFKTGNKTSLFFTRGTNLFFTPDQAVPALSQNLSFQIVGFNVTNPSNVIYQYTETGRLNNSGTELYFSVGDFTSSIPALLSDPSNRYPDPLVLPGPVSVSFNFPPASNPISSSLAEVQIPNLHDKPFTATLYKPSTNQYGNVYTDTLTLAGVGTTMLKLNHLFSFSNVTNRISFTVNVDSVVGNVLKTIKFARVVFDYDTTKATVNPPSYNAIFNTNSFGDTGGTFTIQMSKSVSPYEAGRVFLYTITTDIVASTSVNQLLSSFTTELRDGSNSTFHNETPSTIVNYVDDADEVFIWNGISSFALTSNTITITKSGTWTSNWSYQINSGSVFTVLGTVTVASGLSLVNGDVVLVIQPINGSNLTQTYSNVVFPSNLSTNYTVGTTSQHTYTSLFDTQYTNNGLRFFGYLEPTSTTARVGFGTLGTAYLPSTSSAVTSTSVSANPNARTRTICTIKDPANALYGKRFYTAGESFKIMQHTISGAAWTATSTVAQVSITNTPRVRWMDFNPSGTKLFLYEDTSDMFKAYNLATPFTIVSLDLNSSVFNSAIGISASLFGTSGVIETVEWVNNGSYAYVLTDDGRCALFYTISNPYEISEIFLGNRISIDSTVFNRTGTERSFIMKQTSTVQVGAGQMGVLIAGTSSYLITV